MRPVSVVLSSNGALSMKLTLLCLIALITTLSIGGCEAPEGQSSAYKVEVFAQGALISGVNGIHLALMDIFMRHLLSDQIFQSSI